MQRKPELRFLFNAAFYFIVAGILFYWLIFKVIAPYFFGELGFDKGALATMMGWSATLFIGYAGYYLLDKWKEQENKKIERNEIIFAYKQLVQWTTEAFDLSHRSEWQKTDFNEMKESYYRVYANLVLIEKLSDKLEFSSISKEFSTIYKNVIHIKIEQMDGQLDQNTCKEKIRNYIADVDKIYNKLLSSVRIE